MPLDDDFVLMAAPNGARRNHADHAALPLTPAELADQSRALVDTSVSVLHLHVRDANGAHSLDPELYRSAIAAIRARVGRQLIIQVTTEAVGRYRPQEQMAVVRELRPQAVSLALRELAPDADHEAGASRFFHWLRRESIWPQYILYSPAEAARFEDLRRKGFFGEDDPFCLYVCGSYVGEVPASVDQVHDFLAATTEPRAPWAVCAFGRQEHDVMLEAVAQGGHVRIGFENNLWLRDGELARDNAHLIRQWLQHARHQSRRPASAESVRQAFQVRG
jgi:3-keto-5-aminohexanoate cleavage enzyme